MFSKPVFAGLVLMFMLSAGGFSMAKDAYQVLFDFNGTDAADEWQTVNDGVMGGVSDGQFKISEEKTLEFYGTLSLENNGGFASVRSRSKDLGLKKGDRLVVRLRGDGREYSLNLYTQRRMTAFSYRAVFATKKDEWIEVLLPLDTFVATSFGQVIDNQPLEPGEVNGIGILLGDKKAGRFKLEVEWIKVIKSD